MKNAKTDDEIIRALGFKTFEVHRATFDCIFHVCQYSVSVEWEEH